MKITFLGATHEVTGSCTLIEAGGLYGLVDCGMEQGKDIFENQELPVNPASIDFVFLTHAHIDHSGKIPLLYKNGFRGHVFATEATCNLCDIMLRDSAHIQMFEAEWRNRKAERSGEKPYTPIYDMDDVDGVMRDFKPCSYGQMIKVNEFITIRFTDVGHLLGSSCIEIWMTEQNVTKKILFSGDVGNNNAEIIRAPSTVEETDYLVVESTYGDRLHEPHPDYVKYLSELIQRTLDRGGNVVIPAFAVGRTQELLYFLREIKERGLIKGHGDFPVYVDSPLAIEATNVFLKCSPDYFNDETRAIIKEGQNPLIFPGLKTTVTSDESKAINFDNTPKVIISASGMCEAGRIRHHLKHNLWRSESLILFVGFQAAGTLGRALHDGIKKIKLFGEDVTVNAEIAFLPGKSGHADRNGLIAWVQGIKKKPELIFVNHGEDAVCESFANLLETEYGYKCAAPYSGTIFDALTGSFVLTTEGVPIVKIPSAGKERTSSAAFSNLISVCQRLLAVAHRCEGMANKELAKFTSQIEALCDKWQ